MDLYRPVETVGVVLASIDKRMPGDGMIAGQQLAAGDMFSKAIIVVDKDIDLHDKDQIFHALGTRWQPSPASLLIPQTKGFPLDPSAPTRWVTSKMIIDATRQLARRGRSGKVASCVARPHRGTQPGDIRPGEPTLGRVLEHLAKLRT